MNINKHFGEALKAYVEKKGIAKSWLAREMKVSPQSVTSTFIAESPRQDTKRKVLTALKITEKELYGEEESEFERKYRDLENRLMKANEELLEYKTKENTELKLQNIREQSHINQTIPYHK